MIENACRDFNIDVSQSFMIGDSQRDIECGTNAGCKKSILVSKSYTLLDFVKEYLQG